MQAPQQTSAPVKDIGLVDNDGYLSGGGSSYTYARYSLPRGRLVSRDSAIFQGLSTPHFEWKEPLFQNTPLSGAGIETRLASSSAPKLTLDPQQDDFKASADPFAFDFGSEPPVITLEQPVEEQLAPKHASVSPSQSFKSARSTASSKGGTSVETSGPELVRAPAAPIVEAEDSKSTSSQSNSTLRPLTAMTGTNGTTGYHYMSPDEHVAKGIECHENGSLQESTYHLRIAAMQNHSTAMLLYALACHHGWGMRANQREGVQWLRKALDSAMNELTEDQDASTVSGIRENHDKKARQAQFALSVYELGVSHLNGWGIEQDRALALRCFEVAGHWGDVDALSEAGFCYAEGIGCKKDLKKAARFYRLAEQRGVSMVGNSW
jgi:TPR repeat protein